MVSSRESQTPDEFLDEIFESENKALVDTLLEEIMNRDPDFFEKLVTDLLKKIYGRRFTKKCRGYLYERKPEN
ncbi:MAG: hypothetical protein PWR17_706 [Candidatus Methanomethylophilaceae archaeon]|nr:hypothetical protein [Candidatus Methanomethylophilaceae archaeon]